MKRTLDELSIDRREFCRLALSAVGALSAAACGDALRGGDASAGPGAVADPGPSADAVAVDPGPADPGPPAIDWDATADLPSLGGAPDSHEGRVIAAFVDVVVPGAHRDPTGAPGGLDTGAPALFFDPRLPAAPLVTTLVLFLDSIAEDDFAGRTFDQLTPPERGEALETGMALLSELEFAVQMGKLAYFSTRGAQEHLGYPGANPGYRHDPTFTYGVAVATPHPLTVEGNLP